MKQLTVVDLFAGCGGLSLGFQSAGLEIVAAFEKWERSAICYEQNFGHPVHRADLSDVGSVVPQIRVYSPDIIVGGPPCQDFSHAGKRVEDQRASLTSSFAQIIEDIQPRCFVMENVDRAQKSQAYSRARTIFKNAGYGLTERVIDASLVGVPQKRKRFFCIGILNGEDAELLGGLEEGLQAHETTMRDYFGETLGLEYYYRHPRNYSRRAVYSIDEPSPTVRGVNRPVPKGYPGHPNDACAEIELIRPLTTLERALIQTFPPDFKWIGSKTDLEQMIGNAVPVKLAEYVARILSQHILQEGDGIRKSTADFEQWLIEVHHMSARSASDVRCRLKRANSIHPVALQDGESYLFDLDQAAKFRELPVDRKSQLRRAVRLYAEYCGRPIS